MVRGSRRFISKRKLTMRHRLRLLIDHQVDKKLIGIVWTKMELGSVLTMINKGNVWAMYK